MVEKREKLGKISSDLSQKTPESRSVTEITQAMQEKYSKDLIECVEASRKTAPGDFYIEVVLKNEKLMSNVFRYYFRARHSCPTPNYDQDVYKFNAAAERIEYVWTIPSRDACHHIKDNALIVNESEKELLKFVLDFADGTLMQRAKQLNGESRESILLAQ